MANKYKFNPETFTYHNENKLARISKIVLTQIVAVVFLGLVIFFSLSYFTDSAAERNLKHDNKALEQEYEQLITVYQNNEKNLQQLEMQDDGLYQIIFGAPAPKDSTEELINNISHIKPNSLVNQNTHQLDQLYKHLKSTKQNYINFLDSLKEDLSNTENIPSIQPVPNPNLRLLINGYGYRLDPIYHTPHFHKGIDFNAPIGTPVYATASGTVTNAGYGTKVDGIIVEIKHGDYTTRYEHLNEAKAYVGKKVEKGQVIGYVGTTGKSLIPHLHYEIKYKGKAVNPIFFFYMELSPKEFNEIYKKSVTAGISLD